MNVFNEITAKEITANPFKLLADNWALVTCGNEKSYNTMTVSWGGVGVLWNKNVATIYIRPQRYTYEFLEKNDEFTISFFSNEYKKALNFCGKNSGRDCDKAKETGLTPLIVNDAVSFSEANLILFCKKLYFSDITPNNFLDENLCSNYANNDYHRMYIGEIVKVFKK